MKYNIQQKNKTGLKVGLIWNAIALVLNYIFVPMINYQNGATTGEAIAILIGVLILTLPLFIIDVVLYKLIIKETTRTKLIIAIITSILSILLLVKIPSVLLTATYILIMIKDKVNE